MVHGRVVSSTTLVLATPQPMKHVLLIFTCTVNIALKSENFNEMSNQVKSSHAMMMALGEVQSIFGFGVSF